MCSFPYTSLVHSLIVLDNLDTVELLVSEVIGRHYCSDKESFV